MRPIFLLPVLLLTAQAQPSSRTEFEVASIKTNPPQPGFHFAADAAAGGPGTADPGIFRCSRCSLATLVIKAFMLQPYQFPDRKSFTENTYDVMAKIPTGTTQSEFSIMLQNLLKDRFGLVWHFQDKRMKGYRLTVAKDGPKLAESTGASLPPTAGQHGFGQGESHNHSGAMVFGDSAVYRATNQTTADLARILSDQIGLPVADETGLNGRYDISLRWSSAAGTHAGGHDSGTFSGGHTGHDSASGSPTGPAADPSGPTLFDALQQQLGLKLVPAEQTLAHFLVIDKVAPRPTDN